MLSQTILNLTKRFYPKGRAFRIPVGSLLESFHVGLAVSEAKAYSDAVSILDSIIPDNDNFTEEDATTWERRLGLITNDTVPLADRKLAIIRKMNHPGTIKARQHYLYLERELRAVGFNVRVTENRFLTPAYVSEQMGLSEMGVSEMGGDLENPDKYEVIDPRSLTSELADMGVAEMGDDVEMGGGIGYNLVVNYLDELKDDTFFDSLIDIQDNNNSSEMGVGEMGVGEMGGTFNYIQALRSSFFITGDDVDEMAAILLNRKEEFRQLILRIKPVQSVGILLVNYTQSTQGPDFNTDFNQDFNI
jgi:hypothetical protein